MTTSGFQPERIDLLYQQLSQFPVDQQPLISQRTRENRIVDGHGDLRAEHVCLLPDPVIFDCLEFDDQLRIIDPVDELSFLGLECERLGDASIREILLSAYQEVTGDIPPSTLVAYYAAQRAFMWARLAAWRLADARSDGRAKWIERTATYIHIAERYLMTVTQRNQPHV